MNSLLLGSLAYRLMCAGVLIAAVWLVYAAVV